jgi:hypothetical protein
MSEPNHWLTRVTHELEQARNARQTGNEGRARVCARRAAGIIAAQYLLKQGLTLKGASAYNYLRLLIEIPELPAQTKEVIDHFLLRITPDHNLPVEADLIAEAEWLAQELLDVTL